MKPRHQEKHEERGREPHQQPLPSPHCQTLTQSPSLKASAKQEITTVHELQEASEVGPESANDVLSQASVVSVYESGRFQSGRSAVVTRNDDDDDDGCDTFSGASEVAVSQEQIANQNERFVDAFNKEEREGRMNVGIGFGAGLGFGAGAGLRNRGFNGLRSSTTSNDTRTAKRRATMPSLNLFASSGAMSRALEGDDLTDF